jgi:hypothetical protein
MYPLAPTTRIRTRQAYVRLDQSHVDTLDSDGVQRRWRVGEILEATRAGDRFLITIGGTRTATTLEPAICPVCPPVYSMLRAAR